MIGSPMDVVTESPALFWLCIVVGVALLVVVLALLDELNGPEM